MDSKLHTYNFQLAFPGAFYGQAWLPHMYKAYRLKCDVVFGINKLGPLWHGAQYIPILGYQDLSYSFSVVHLIPESPQWYRGEGLDL